MLPESQITDKLKVIGTNLKIARQRRRLSQSSVADRINVDRRTVARIEAGDQTISMKHVLLLLDIYGLLDALTVADANSDAVGKALELSRSPKRVHESEEMSNDF